MKLRIRSFETKETIKIEVPSSCTVQELKHFISQASQSSSSSSDSIHLSLNRTDELPSSSSSSNSLQSLGIASGDLIFFTSNPNLFSSSSSVKDSNFPEKMDSQIVQDSVFSKEMDTQIVQESEGVKKLDTQIVPESEGMEKYGTQEMGTGNVVSQEEEMEVDTGDSSGDVNLTKSFSVPGFLRKVFMEELGDDGGRDHKLLMVAVHAVFVESGFVLLDPVSFDVQSESHFWKYCPNASRTCLLYALSEVMNNVKCDKPVKPDIQTVALKFQVFGKFCIAYGSLSHGASTRRVTLNENQLVPFLNVVWANCGLHEGLIGTDGVRGDTPEKAVFQFWRNVKDELVLPLLIDICEKSGLVLPPCFMRLPTDLKLKILDLLPGAEIAKVSCLCSELRYLTSSDDLWKKKFVEQFGDASTSGEGGHWKEKFVRSWESRKRRKFVARSRRPAHPRFFGGGPQPFPVPWMPHIIGGDHDIFPPQFGNGSDRISWVLPPASSNYIRHCHHGGHRSSLI